MSLSVGHGPDDSAAMRTGSKNKKARALWDCAGLSSAPLWEDGRNLGL